MKKSATTYPYHLTPGGPALTRQLLGLVTPERPPQRALLIGCRFGENVFAAAEALGCPCLGVEEDSEAILFAKMAAGASSLVSFRFMSPLTLSFEDGAFDVVIMEGVCAEHPRTRAISEAARVLAPGGVLALADSCWLTDAPPPSVRNVWETPTHKIARAEELVSAMSVHVEVRATHDASQVLRPFYAQFSDEVRSIVAGRFEGMKHHKALVRHYKHEIDVYTRHGGDRHMGYLLVAGIKGGNPADSPAMTRGT